MDQYLNMNELTGLYNISRVTTYRLIKKGLPFIKIRKSIRFSKEMVEDWLYEQKKIAERAEAILQVGVYRCVACGKEGTVTSPISLKEARCPQCQTKGQVELVRLRTKQEA